MRCKLSLHALHFTILSVVFPVASLAYEQQLVFDPFTDGGTTQGADPLDVRWFTSDNTNVVLEVVEDALLDPMPPYRVARFLINNPAETEKDDYIFFALPELVELAVGDGLQVRFRLRFEGGAPRADASRTGVSLAYRAPADGQTPWARPDNREYFFFTSFGETGFSGSIRRSSGIQFLNTGTVLAANTPSVDLGSDMGTVFFEVARLDENTLRIRYALNGAPPREVVDSEAITTLFSHVFLRYRRATLQPLEAVHIDDMEVVLAPADLSEPEPQTWYVSPTGSDSQSGNDPASPFRTINHALSWSRAGDTILVGEGVYRESVFFPYAGEPDRPITLRAVMQADGGFENVVVTGFEPIVPGADGVGEWTHHAGSIWKIQLPSQRVQPLGRNLVEVDGEVMLPARWPTATAAVDFDRRGMAEASSGSVDTSTAHPQPPYAGMDFYNATYTDASLNSFATNTWTGAHIDVCAGHNWWPKTGVITGNEGDVLSFRYRFSTAWNPVIDTPKEGDRYALWGHLAALDSPGEFFLDVHGINGPPNTLYLWLPDSGSPDGRSICALARSESVVMGNRSHLYVEGIRVRGGTVTMAAGSQSNRLDHVEVDYGAVNRNLLQPGSGVSVLLAGDGHLFTNGRVGHTFGRSISVVGSGTEVSNTVSHDASSHLITLHSALGAHITGNTTFRSGDTAIDIGAKATIIELNHAYHAGMRITDIAILNTWNSGDMQGTEIRYNWAHSNLAPHDSSRSWWGGQGIRLDSGGSPNGCSNARIHHNVVWNTTAASSLTFWGLDEGMANFGDSRIEVFHNTLENSLVFGGSGSVAGGDVRNNIARLFNNPVGSVEGMVFADNLFRDSAVPGNFQADPGYVSSPNRNFSLRPLSFAIGVGASVEGVTEASPENYLGAYNPAMPAWTPGARLRAVDLARLETRVDLDAFGQTRAVVNGLPAGRTFPDTFAMRLDGRSADSWFARYSPADHAVTGVFSIDLAGLGPTALVEFSFDGVTWVVPDAAVVSLPLPSLESGMTYVGLAAGGSEHILSGNDLAGATSPVMPVDLEGLAGNDFIEEAIPWMVDTGPWIAAGMAFDGGDLRILSWDGITPIRHHVEYGIGRANTLIWLMSGSGDGSEEIISFEDRSRLFVSVGSGSGEDDPAVLTDSFPALASADRLLHLRAHDLAEGAAGNDSVSNWPDRSPNEHPVVQSDPASQPVVRMDAFGGLPAVEFDGVADHFDVNGAAGLENGSARIFTVFRNPDPGTVRWQRLYSARPSAEALDYEVGYFAIVPTTPEGDPLTNPSPTIREMNRVGSFSGENFRIGRRSLANAEHFRGEIAEIIAFGFNLAGTPREQLLRYLRRKYGIGDRPTVTLDTETRVPLLQVFVGAEEALWVRREPDGSLRFVAPPAPVDATLPLTVNIRLLLPDGRELVQPDAYTYTVDGLPPHTFATWAAVLPENERGPLETFGTHSLSNLMRFAFGQEALDAAYPSGLPLVYDLPEEGMRMEFVRRSGGVLSESHYETDGLRYILESSTSLADWVPADWQVIAVETLGGGTERVRLHLPLAPPKIFYRLRILLLD